jgi:DNA-binding NtrC family response regulator
MKMRERMKIILYIDDSESHRFVLEEELSEEGYKVVTANNIEEVLSKRPDFNPDLVILELRQRNVREKSFEELKKQYPSIPWVGYSPSPNVWTNLENGSSSIYRSLVR